MSAAGDRMIKTAACLIIGDEVLGGKTVDVRILDSEKLLSKTRRDNGTHELTF
ncbi:uncharacterized protein TrAFT101_001026 [Trichoderma asperellum]|uniref:uncharacterized protein n=1 Tax=Trichoderma asperellum TaxID=101201 RepID=UPI0033257BF9|nr:hypothetical protein TrAFT101_001026 [Trichoderma asperellum]